MTNIKMKNIDSYTHVRGESIYLDDIPLQAGTLFAAVFDSPIAHGKIASLDTSEAEKTGGVVRIFTARDIPGENQIGGIVADGAAPPEPEADAGVPFSYDPA